jgi:hypothetical protein
MDLRFMVTNQIGDVYEHKYILTTDPFKIVNYRQESNQVPAEIA